MAECCQSAAGIADRRGFRGRVKAPHRRLVWRFAGVLQRIFGFEAFFHDERMCALGVPGGGVLLLFRSGGSAHPQPDTGRHDPCA